MHHIVYHSADLDGICSAAVVADNLKNQRRTPQAYRLWPFDYGQDHLDLLAALEPDDTLYLMDFSFPPPVMEQLHANVRTFGWWDHHLTAIEAARGRAYEHVFGRRRDNYAACELVWDTFHPGTTSPLVFHLGRWDVWDHQHPATRPVQFGARALLGHLPPDHRDWAIAIWDSSWAGRYYEAGELIESWERQNAARAVTNAIPIMFAGHRALALNARGGSDAFAAHPLLPRTELLLAFGQCSDRRWRCSLYRGPAAPPDLDCGQLAKTLGGGGHPGAAGFLASAPPTDQARGWEEAGK